MKLTDANLKTLASGHELLIKISEEPDLRMNSYSVWMVEEMAQEVLTLRARIEELEDEIIGLKEVRQIVERSLDNEYSISTALRARIAELEADNRWIPVCEGLPEVDGKYLAANSCVTTFLYFESGRWIFDNDGLAYVVNPTHWRPLPKPPEVE